MVERGGVRTAVIGIALSTTPSIVMAGRVEGLDFRPEAPAIDRAAREARAAGADFVVVTMHVGAHCEDSGEAPGESTGCEGEMMEIAAALTEPVDLIVGGHTHTRVLATAWRHSRRRGGQLLHRLQRDRPGAGGRPRGGHRREVRVAWADEVDADTLVARLVEEWEREVRPLTERVVATAATALERTGSEYPLGNLIADALRSETGAHASLVNNGSIRRALPAGALTWGMLYELQPFQNQLVTWT
jgi:2',3'-cyclic-nucleotide 2'-phosphodiesterase (5'-nucleotidase family)